MLGQNILLYYDPGSGMALDDQSLDWIIPFKEDKVVDTSQTSPISYQVAAS
jgi:hypothetical protein